MVFKINISESGKTYKAETENEFFVGRHVGEKVHGKEIKHELEGYELEITGATDIAGFPHKKDVEGPELKRVLFTKGWGMRKKPRWAGKHKTQTSKGLRLKKTVRGKQLSEKTVQINMKVVKKGSTPLTEVFAAPAPKQ